MSTIQVPNIHFTTTGNRIQYDNSNTISVVVANNEVMSINSSAVLANTNSTLVTANVIETLALSSNGQQITPYTNYFKNYIINGNFDAWQRGISNTSIADNQFLADRWKCSRIGSTANVSRQSFTLGQTDVPGEPEFFHRTIVTTSAGAGNFNMLRHPIEGCRTLAGKPITLSFWAKADATKNISIEFEQYFGNGGSPSASVSFGTKKISLSTSWTKYTVFTTAPLLTGKTIGTDGRDNLSVNFWFDAGSNFNSRTDSLGQQSGTFDIARVQLEEGSVATAFEERPKAIEYTLCWRYYHSTSHDPSSSAQRKWNLRGSTIEYCVEFQFPTTMRTDPVIVVYGDVADGSRVQLSGTTILRPWAFTQFHSVANGQWLDYHYHLADAEL